jgi:energy-coupling factor transporter ATP-binding protein EcfA2
MLNSLAIRNFKCFSNLRLSLAPLTLLAGYNGGGKSTSVQALLLISQALRFRSNPSALSLNGPMVKLGTAGDVVQTTGLPVFEIKAGQHDVRWQLAARAGERSLFVNDATAHDSLGPPITWNGTIWPRDASSERRLRTLRTALSTLSFLTAIRSGTPDVYPLPEVDDGVIGDVGSEGQFAAYWYDQMVDEEVPPGRSHRTGATTLRKELDTTLSLLFPNAQANVTAIAQTSSLTLRFRIGDTSEWRRPANIGFGFTYAFPILVALLTMPEGQTFVIDSPEAHLHPSAQSEMGRILARMASSGVQVIAESHSDHLLNGIRLAVKEGLIQHDQVAIHFFGGPNLDAHGVISPSIDAAGAISDWPSGFFDQTEKDLAHLSGWN